MSQLVKLYSTVLQPVVKRRKKNSLCLNDSLCLFDAPYSDDTQVQFKLKFRI